MELYEATIELRMRRPLLDDGRSIEHRVIQANTREEAHDKASEICRNLRNSRQNARVVSVNYFNSSPTEIL